MEPPAETPPSATRAISFPAPDINTIDAYRAEILVLAFGILLLVSQLSLIIWLFARPCASVGQDRRTQRSISWTAVDARPRVQVSSEDERGRTSHRRSFRRSSTWNGRSSARAPDEQLLPRRKSYRLELLDLASPLSSPETDPESSNRDSLRRGGRDVGLMAAALAMPMMAPSPRRLRSPLGSAEPEGFTREMGIMPRSPGGVAADLSPRPLRVVPLDQETVNAILEAESRQEGDMTPLPVTPPAIGEEEDLTNGFDDPLGVNRQTTGLKYEETPRGDGQKG